MFHKLKKTIDLVSAIDAVLSFFGCIYHCWMFLSDPSESNADLFGWAKFFPQGQNWYPHKLSGRPQQKDNRRS